MKRFALIAITATIALAGCGGSTDPARAKLVNRCVAGGSTHTECVCTLDAATALGVSLDTIARQENKGIIGADRRLVLAGLECVGR
jgi:hypothetical protein